MELLFKTSLLPILIILGLAYIYHVLVRPDVKPITHITLSVFVPIFIFHELAAHHIRLQALIKPFYFMVLLTTALVILSLLVAEMLKAEDNDRIAFMIACAMINVGNFGLPLMSFAFTPRADTHALIYFTVFAVPMSTLAIYIASPQKDIISSVMHIAKIPLIHALIAGLAVSYFSLKLPAYVTKTTAIMSKPTLPLIIFILGLQLARIQFKSSYLILAGAAIIIRLVLSPVIAFPILSFLGISGLQKQVAIVQTSTPAALLPLLYAIHYERSAELLAVIILSSTIISGITLTVLMKVV